MKSVVVDVVAERVCVRVYVCVRACCALERVRKQSTQGERAKKEEKRIPWVRGETTRVELYTSGKYVKVKRVAAVHTVNR